MKRLESAPNQAERRIATSDLRWVGTALSADWWRPSRSCGTYLWGAAQATTDPGDDGVTVACSAVLARQPPPLSPARGPPQSDLLTGLLDQTPAFDPAEPEPHPAFEFDQSLPRRLRPLSSLTVAGSPALACGAHPRIPLAQHLAELLRLLPRQPLCGCPIRASPPHFASGHGSPFEYPIGRSASEEGYSRRPPCLPPRWMRTV
jgi:hypothetical protein